MLLSGCRVDDKADSVSSGTAPRDAVRPTDADPPLRVWPATQPFSAMPGADVHTDLATDHGPLEAFRHALSVGGINPSPIPDRAVEGARKLHPQLIRVFIQEFFSIYPEHDRFDWTKLDPYMDALDRTGAKVIAAITIKPRPLFPAINASIWRPNDIQEWQRVVAALVRRYSVERQLVTHWEIGNEPDIGESGGCPYLITDPADYLEYYKMTTQAILHAFPQARVGGPAVADAGGNYLPEFIRLCREQKVRLDFISWHLYSDDTRAHAKLAEKYATLLSNFPGTRPQMLVTEWCKGFDPISIEEEAFNPRRAAMTAAAVIAMSDARVDWSFYYHLNDQPARWDDFKPFFSDPGIMYHHWNELPHRFGLFGVSGEVRPQYFVYQMLSRLPATRLAVRCDQQDLHALASKGPDRVALLLSNYGLPTSRDYIATLRFTGVPAGPKRLVIYRIDRAASWSEKRLEMIPIETRDIDARGDFTCQTYCPADSVMMAVLKSAHVDK